MSQEVKDKNALSIEQKLSTFGNDLISISNKLWIKFYLTIFLFVFNWIMYFLNKEYFGKVVFLGDYDITDVAKFIPLITIIVDIITVLFLVVLEVITISKIGDAGMNIKS